jgi:hypothetical protein
MVLNFFELAAHLLKKKIRLYICSRKKNMAAHVTVKMMLKE